MDCTAAALGTTSMLQFDFVAVLCDGDKLLLFFCFCFGSYGTTPMVITRTFKGGCTSNKTGPQFLLDSFYQ